MVGKCTIRFNSTQEMPASKKSKCYELMLDLMTLAESLIANDILLCLKPLSPFSC